MESGVANKGDYVDSRAYRYLGDCHITRRRDPVRTSIPERSGRDESINF